MSHPRPLALVTGAARRVGRAIALSLAEAGFDLILTCHENLSGLDQTVELTRNAAGTPAFTADRVAIDLNDDHAVDRWCARLRQLPRVDAIVHNASAYDRSPLGSISASDAIRQLRINAIAPLLITQALAQPLRRSILPNRAAVICIGDIHSLGRPRRDFSAYAMSKAALMQLVHCLAIELAPAVRVNGVAPGVIAWPENTADAERKAYESRIPLGRSGSPEDAAAIVRWLIMEATYVTGEIIRLDGGRWLR